MKKQESPGFSRGEHVNTDQLPTLPGCVDGIVGHDLLGWTVQCRECGVTQTHRMLILAMSLPLEIRFHALGWPDGTNPRLCRHCRLARGCDCHGCRSEEQGTDFPTAGRRT